MKKEPGKLALIAYDISQSEKNKLESWKKGVLLFLEVRDDKGKPWVRSDVDSDEKIQILVVY